MINHTNKLTPEELESLYQVPEYHARLAYIYLLRIGCLETLPQNVHDEVCEYLNTIVQDYLQARSTPTVLVSTHTDLIS